MKPSLSPQDRKSVGLALRSIKGETGEDGSLLDAAMSLGCKEFIAHAYCQSVINEMWCGRSACCGRIYLRQRPKVYLLVLQLWLLPVRCSWSSCDAAACGSVQCAVAAAPTGAVQ